MNEEREAIKFQSKAEIAHAIQSLTPFTLAGGVIQQGEEKDFNFAINKIKELAKLL